MTQPVQRLDEPLPDGRIEIQDADGEVHIFGRDALLVATASDFSGSKKLAIGAPGAAPSALSGASAYWYRAGDVEIAVTREELHRLVFHALRPEEYRALRDAVGVFHEIGPDFYEPETGRALQPMVRVPGT